MRRLTNSQFYVWFIFLIGIGFLGAVLFFPMTLDDRYTCLYHRLFSTDHPVQYQSVLNDGMTGNHVAPEHKQALLKVYLIPFGLFWWASLSVLIIGIYWFRNKNRSQIDLEKTSAQTQ